jgi:hypothetical protein
MFLQVILEKLYKLEMDLSGSDSVMMNYPVISGEKEIMAVFHQGNYVFRYNSLPLA